MLYSLSNQINAYIFLFKKYLKKGTDTLDPVANNQTDLQTKVSGSEEDFSAKNYVQSK